MVGVKVKDRNYLFVVALILVSLVSGYIGANLFPEKEIVYRAVTQIDTLKQVDTVVTYIKVPDIRVKKVVDVVYVRDTIIETKPFVATIDTILVETKDTLSASYYFPENYFDLQMRFGERKAVEVYKYITITNEVEKEEPWWIKPAYFVGGACTGFLFGIIK